MNPFRIRDRSGYPGEPLYTLDEIADRLPMPYPRLRAMLSHHPGLKAWRRVGGGTTARMLQNLYRLSDARRWFATLPEFWEPKIDTRRIEDRAARSGTDDQRGIAALL